ncbi:MAG: iron-siderophore ABC transporter substrate-binding protein [Pseudomonadota bacterium]|nr:iron-siderophore ABC transporter substrate-binding protein [Pseudomonadota bacterium]
MRAMFRKTSAGVVAAIGLAALALLVPVSASAQQDSRVLETANGKVTVNGQPTRVVTLYEGALDASLAAGVTPLGAVATRAAEDVADYLRDDVPDIQIVGTSGEVNVEAVVGLKPDLILASSRLSDETYALLSQLAPTIVPTTQGFDANAWKDEARLFGAALGHQDQVDAAIDAVETRAASLADQVAERSAGDSAFLIRWMPQGPLVMSTRLFSTGLLEAAGLDVQDDGLVPDNRPHSDPLSLESLSRVDGDWLFLATLDEKGQEALAQARQSDAFARLSVVENDRVVAVNGQLWTSANGPIAAQAVLDDIERALEVTAAP